MSDILLSVVVPVYNEEESIKTSIKRLLDVIDNIDGECEIILSNDGSRDGTVGIIKMMASEDDRIKLVDLSRNFGQQIAITAGLDYSSGRAVVIIDADMQDPPELIPDMLKLWRDGNDVVYGQRIVREGESFFKKVSAKIFYRLLRSLTGRDIPVDSGAFRLIDRRVCDALISMREANRFTRGLVNWVGFKQTPIRFHRDERLAGETKFTLGKMINLALDAIISFSFKPLRFATYVGSGISALSFIYLIYIIISTLAGTRTEAGWASLAAINLFLSGMILIILGIMGEYIGRAYEETKNRPLYWVRDEINFKDEE